MKKAVYFCKCGTNISEKIDPALVSAQIGPLEDVGYVREVDFLCSEEGREFLEADLRAEKPDCIVIAACSPRDHEKTFMRVMKAAGMNPYLMQMTNIREQVAWVTEDPAQATDKAIRYIATALDRVGLHEPLEDGLLDMDTAVMVIGAGPAGLRAALSLAEAGRKVIVVEKTPFMGGQPVLFEEVFPNMECGPCLLEPLMDEALHGEHVDNIELMTMAEVTEVVGFYGNFTVTVRQSPRRVDAGKCIGCAECVGPCPVSAPNKYNCNLNDRKAIDFTFPGALPNAPTLDWSLCVRAKGEECTACRDACPVEGAIVFDDEGATVERHVGAIIMAVGSTLYDCANIPGLGYGSVPGVLSSLEFERMMASNGPTGGEVALPSGEAPKSIAIVHCVGSLDERHRKYCSGICCEYAFKFNHQIQHKLPGTKIYHLYKELSLAGKEEFSLYDKAKHNPDAKFIRYGSIEDIAIVADGAGQKLAYIDSAGAQGTMATDLIVLCPAVVPTEGAQKLGAMFDVTSDREGFFEELHGRIDSSKSKIKGVFIAGTCQSPMDIKGAMNQGMAAAGYILSGLVAGRQLEVKPITAEVDKERCSGCRVCVSVCPYKAIAFSAGKEAAEVNPVLCQGCGTCVAACPVGAIKGNHFTNAEIFAEIEGVLKA